MTSRKEHPMKMLTALLLVGCAGLANGCATVVPSELASARQAYRRASSGPAATLSPAELHKAREALVLAERSFAADPTGYHTLDLAYVAQRKAEMAEALAAISSEAGRNSRSKAEFQSTQTQIIKKTKGDLQETRAELNDSERTGQKTADELATQTRARAEAERRAASAQEALARLAALKQEERGMVITLSGSVLFASNQAVLLPEAQTRLVQVADAMLATKERTAIVEGHTDSRGSPSHNVDLSQRRADAVRSFLVSRGYDPDRITAHGLGKVRPIADNNSAEGRANNRRVEIVVEPLKTMSAT
jgi:outer membrane protein OmpA-like peptidoglycan-associated protein